MISKIHAKGAPNEAISIYQALIARKSSIDPTASLNIQLDSPLGKL